jgi:hypothetical protein
VWARKSRKHEGVAEGGKLVAVWLHTFQAVPGRKLTTVGSCWYPLVTGLVWFITGAGGCHSVCIVGTAPLQLQRVLVWLL